MIQYILWIVSFISLWITLVWLNVLVLEPSKKRFSTRKPSVTIALPCYNKAPYLEKTIKSLAELDYPRKLLQIIIVDDRSTDNTYSVAKRLQKKYAKADITVLRHDTNKGKAVAMNTALEQSKGELFACLDADTRVMPDSVSKLVPHFTNNVGAVIGQVRVDNPSNVYERVQRVEYILSNFIRRIWSSMSTLWVAPGGALSLFNADIIRKIGGFDEAGMTEDLEIAMRLKANGYDVKMEPKAITFTSVPRSWGAVWRQRIRWYRGFAFNHWRYRHLLFKKSHGLFGTFQLPMNIISVGTLLLTLLLVSYGTLTDLFETLYRSLTIKGYFLNHLLDFPTIKEIMLSQNIQVTLPIVIGTFLIIYLTYFAHKQVNERMLPNLHYLGVYFFVVPYVSTLHWISAIMQEAFRVRRKW